MEHYNLRSKLSDVPIATQLHCFLFSYRNTPLRCCTVTKALVLQTNIYFTKVMQMRIQSEFRLDSGTRKSAQEFWALGRADYVNKIAVRAVSGERQARLHSLQHRPSMGTSCRSDNCKVVLCS